MPQTLEEFVRGTPFAGELERLRLIESEARVVLVLIDRVGLNRVAKSLAVAPAIERLRKAVG